MKNRYVRYIFYSIVIMIYGLAANVMGIPDLFRFSEWCELGYRSRDSMVTMSYIFVIMGIGIFIFGSALLVFSIKKYSTLKQRLAKVNNFTNDKMEINKFEKALIMFLSLTIVNVVIVFLRETVF